MMHFGFAVSLLRKTAAFLSRLVRKAANEPLSRTKATNPLLYIAVIEELIVTRSA
jgi:hypothetical protein